MINKHISDYTLTLLLFQEATGYDVQMENMEFDTQSNRLTIISNRLWPLDFQNTEPDPL